MGRENLELIKKGIFAFALLFFSCTLTPKVSVGVNITQQIHQKIAEVFKDDTNVIGVGLIYLETGEIMLSHPFRLDLVKGKRPLLAAMLTNITKAIVGNLKKAGMRVEFANIRCKEGLFLLTPINDEVVLVGFFKPNANVQEEKWHILHELKPAIAEILQ